VASSLTFDPRRKEWILIMLLGTHGSLTETRVVE